MLGKLNTYVNRRIDDYLKLQVYNQEVRTPYHINHVGPFINDLLERAQVSKDRADKIHNMYKNREVPFGWYRGKGSPEEIENAVIEISEKLGPSLKNATPKGIREYMKLYGLGVDCSGFLFHVLSFALEKAVMLDKFMDSLAWADDEKRQANYAGAFIFTGKASTKITPKELRPLDLVLVKIGNEYSHIALVVERNNKLMLAQSNLDSKPAGITLSEIDKTENSPIFSYKPQISRDWNICYEEGIIEFRRLKILSDL